MPTTATTRSQRRLAYFWLITNVIVWGAALVVSKPALEVATPFRFLLYRYVLASLLSIPVLIRYLPNTKKLAPALPKIAALELLGTTVALSFLYAGLARTSAIEASLIVTTIPVFVTLGGVFILKEKEEKHELIGLILALLGTGLLVLWPVLNHTSAAVKSQTSTLGNLITFGHNLSISAYYLWAKVAYRKLPKFFVTTVSFWIGMISFAGLAIIEAGSLTQFWHSVAADWQSPAVVWASFYMALFGSIIGLTAYIKGQDLIEASEASVFQYLQPLVALPLGILWLGEVVSTWQLLAIGIILAGVFLSERPTSRKKAGRKRV